ncbi:2-dehydropantoate 2-reductase N-terminal domain-containing protein [Dactylosporangium sp. NPDC005572]|uniref:ketopantoate reductase family protein n=1 Tax=Dactylosporangium sp. NPDC005572 TaxID=3156889 RepID=UPI0033A17965
MADLRIAVLGTGANGASIGADLTRAGHDVTFIEQWPDHVEAMRAAGLRVEMPDETVETVVRAHHLCEVATMRHHFDVVFVLMKAYDTRWACELIKPLVAEHGLVVGLQNGMTVDTIADVVGVERTLGAVIEVTSAMFTPGVVERHTPPGRSWFALGGLTATATARAPEIAAILGAAGTVEVVDDIRSAKWMKLVVNAGELVPSAILGLTMHAAVATPGMRDFMLRAGLEAAETAVAVGNRLVPIFGLTGLDLADPASFVESLLDSVMHDFALPHTRTTVLQDWMKGRRSEVHEINGLVVDLQRARGGTAPANEVTVEVARRIEAGELVAGPDNLTLLTPTLATTSQE